MPSAASLYFCCVPPLFHISFTQIFMLTSPLPELSGQGKRGELDFQPCREPQAAPREAVKLCLCASVSVCTRVREAQAGASPLTAFHSCDVINSTDSLWLLILCWLFNHSLAGMLECICLKANRAQWPGLSRTQTQAQCLASARALCSRRKSAQTGRLMRDRDKKNPAWKCWI